MFSERKTAQMATWFLLQGHGCMNVLKLMKLLYLADRESMDRYGYPISFDCPVSMPHGPVLSGVLELINGECGGAPDGWEDRIEDRENHQVRLRRPGQQTADLDELSEADREVLAAVYGRYGHMDQWQLRDFTHRECAEWQDPAGSSRPIAYADIFRALGRDEQTAREQEEEILEQKRISSVFAQA